MPGNKPYLPRLIATSVVRGSEQGDSHGGVFTVDFDKQEAFQHVDWNTSEIDFSGRGWDRGLCPLSDRFIAGGSSPSTISVYDLYSGKVVVSVNLSMDIRNAIHGLEVWPHA